ncbi:MAG: hypothetical protein ACK44W_02070 [Planctomycetota bacterium]
MTYTVELSDEDVALLRELLRGEQAALHSMIRRTDVPHEDLHQRRRRIDRMLEALERGCRSVQSGKESG